VADAARGLAGHRGRLGSDPDLPGQVAHQYTDGTGFSPNLPQECPPFGNCDMSSADGLTPVDAIAAIKRDPESPADLQASKPSPAQQGSS
jgi:hypothetical protein